VEEAQPAPHREDAMKLYYHPLSGHAHRAHLFLSLLEIAHDLVEVDFKAGAHKAPAFLQMNRFGQVPVLDDDGTLVSDSNAILVYLAKKHRRSDWLPETPEGAAAVQRWLSVAAGQIAFGPAAARLVTLFGAKFNAEEVIARAHAVVTVIDAELEGRSWIAAPQPTIADVALYSYIARAPEGNVDLSAYRNVLAWLGRIEALPGFVAFQKSPVGVAA
jgi:glutathione S-transferase